MKKLFLWIILLIYHFAFGQLDETDIVFPGAKGFGAEWKFNQDYEIIVVTNLNDKGKGSLRDAILSSTSHAAKIIVFNGLSGTIELESTIEFKGGKQIYLAGQTSEKGILIKGSDFDGALLNMGWNAIDGVIIRSVILARGPSPTKDIGNSDCLQVGYNANNVIIDHCTFLWATDENLQIWGGGNNITIQNCIIGEGLQNSTHPKGNHSCGFIIGTDNNKLPNKISVYNNLFTQNNTRNPVLYKVGEDIELVRNIIYNAKSHAIDALSINGFGKKLNIINNYAIDGNNAHIKGAHIAIETGNIYVYAKGNINKFRQSSTNPEWDAIRNRSDRYLTATKSQQSLVPYNYPLKDESIVTHAELLEKQISISGVGTFTRNSVEIRLINDVNKRTGSIIDNPNDVGGYPIISFGSIIADSNNNGIPNILEGTWGNDTFGYINSIAVGNVDTSTGSIDANAGSDQAICLGESVTLTASGGSSYSWNTGATTKSITVSPNSTTTYTVTVSEGSVSDSDSVQVTVNSVTANAGSDKTMYEGESVTLTASGGNSYIWSTGATTKSITVSPQETQNYTLTAYKNGCEDTDTVQVTVNKNDTSPPPAKANAGEDQTICLGDNIKLTASGGKTYVWSTGETTQSIYVNPTRTTSYTVTATRGGVTNSDVVVVTVENCSAIGEGAPQDEFIVYPNPTKGSINISVKNINEKFTIFVSDTKGSIIYLNETQTKKSNFYKKIDLSKLEKGIYFVGLNSATINNVVKKVIYSE